MHHFVRTEIARVNAYTATEIIPILRSIVEFANAPWTKEDTESATISKVARCAAAIAVKIEEIKYGAPISHNIINLPIITSTILGRSKSRVGAADIALIYAESVFKLQAEHTHINKLGASISPSALQFLNTIIQNLHQLIMAIRAHQNTYTLGFASTQHMSKRVAEARIIESAIRAAELPVLVLKTQIAVFFARVLAMHPLSSILISKFGSQIRIDVPDYLI
jgi:hypothetical protein